MCVYGIFRLSSSFSSNNRGGYKPSKHTTAAHQHIHFCSVLQRPVPGSEALPVHNKDTFIAFNSDGLLQPGFGQPLMLPAGKLELAAAGTVLQRMQASQSVHLCLLVRQLCLLVWSACCQIKHLTWHPSLLLDALVPLPSLPPSPSPLPATASMCDSHHRHHSHEAAQGQRCL